MRARALVAGAALLAVLAAACGGAGRSGDSRGRSPLSGTILVDGSSTVFPLSEAVAEEFQKHNPGVRVTVGQSGTGGGFKKFCNGETDINDASRPITPEEAQACRAKRIEYVELKVAIDGLSVVVNRENSFADCLTIDQLRRIWAPASTVRTWRDVDPGWPAQPIKLYGPGPDSGTFDFFTEVVVGAAKQSRSDYTASEDDNVLVQGVAGDRYALGYFGLAYLEHNLDKIKALAVDGGSGCVKPSRQTVESGSYRPLSRPLFIYPKRASLARPEVRAFVRYYLDTVSSLVADVGYLKLPAGELAASKQAVERAAGG